MGPSIPDNVLYHVYSLDACFLFNQGRELSDSNQLGREKVHAPRYPIDIDGENTSVSRFGERLPRARVCPNKTYRELLSFGVRI